MCDSRAKKEDSRRVLKFFKPGSSVPCWRLAVMKWNSWVLDLRDGGRMWEIIARLKLCK